MTATTSAMMAISTGRIAFGNHNHDLGFRKGSDKLPSRRMQRTEPFRRPEATLVVVLLLAGSAVSCARFKENDWGPPIADAGDDGPTGSGNDASPEVGHDAPLP